MILNDFLNVLSGNYLINLRIINSSSENIGNFESVRCIQERVPHFLNYIIEDIDMSAEECQSPYPIIEILLRKQ